MKEINALSSTVTAPVHVLNTWLIAHLLHPFIWWFANLFSSTLISFDIAAIIVIVGALVSLPALFACISLLAIIKKTSWPVAIKIAVWMIALLVMVYISFWFPLLLIDGQVYFSETELVIPALIAVLLSSFFRLWQLKNYFSLNTNNSASF